MMVLLRDQAVRGKKVIVEPEASVASIDSATPFATSPSVSQADGSPFDSNKAPSPAPLFDRFYVENLTRTAQAEDIAAAFTTGMGSSVVSHVTMTVGGGSAVVTLKEGCSEEVMKAKMVGAEIKGRKLVVSPELSTELASPVGAQMDVDSTVAPSVPSVPSLPAVAAQTSPATTTRPARRHDWDSDDEADPQQSFFVPSPSTHDRKSSTVSASSAISDLTAATSLAASPRAALPDVTESTSAIDLLMQPLDAPPSNAFNRTAQLDVVFGHLKPKIAKLAQSGRKPFSGDEAMQLNYEKFLAAQTGESKDPYGM